jgi:maltose/maltodextrin transport system permease protein
MTTVMRAPSPRSAAPAPSGLLTWAIAGLVTLGLLWLAFSMFVAGQGPLAVGLLAFGLIAVYVYASSTTLAWKYLFPGVAGMLIFVAFPLVYTMQIGFTNYSSSHLLTQDRARAYLLEQTEVDEATLRPYALHREGQALRLVLQPGDAGGETLVSPAWVPAQGDRAPLALSPGAAPTSPALTLREIIALRPALQPLQLALPQGITLQYAGLREFGVVQPLWEPVDGGAVRQRATGEVFRPNTDRGWFANDAGQTLQPGFKVNVGFANYSRMLLDADFRGPFVSIFIWTVTFAGLSVLFTTALGMSLAVLLNWERLRGRTVYRTLLFLPYAVPGFISILVFKGLFNQNFGEINAILDAVFGVRPAWFADPLLAKTMILIVNTWLGYPYIMVLCTGLIKAIPSDLYEASALAGAGPLTNFFRITAPLIIKPLTPLLISVFAFNFNNFVLIALLTDGRPDYLNTKLPAGTTDILVSYTYRIAFTDAGQNFGLAAAISTLIFFMVALMSIVQLRAMRASANKS